MFPLVGPSSIVLALMASGLNGQRFAFNGYLPHARRSASTAFANWKKDRGELGQTEIFIEAPYRNDQLFSASARTCNPETLLCLATDLTGATEQVCTKSIGAMDKMRRRSWTAGRPYSCLLARTPGLQRTGEFSEPRDRPRTD